MQNEEQTLQTLAELILVNRCSEGGFDACTRLVDDGECRELFVANARRSGAAARELEHLARGLDAGSGDATRGIVIGRRGWLAFQSVPCGLDDAALLARCEHAEGHALEVYRNALDDLLPEDVRAVVQRQFERVIDDHERLTALQQARSLAARVAMERAAPAAIVRLAGNG